jgi:hypothetical protein
MGNETAVHALEKDIIFYKSTNTCNESLFQYSYDNQSF